jgi:hypothetical protein
MSDPLIYFLEQYPLNLNSIKDIADGEKYLGIELDTGGLGVCAKLQETFRVSDLDLTHPDPKQNSHRIFLIAYYNALFNTEDLPLGQDIFDSVNFKAYSNIVMIGHFVSLAKKFKQECIPLSIFDLYDTSSAVTDLSKREEHLSEASAIILSSTTLFNQTFSEMQSHFHPNADVFMLGPSTILHNDMVKFSNIKGLCGTIFFQKKEVLFQKILEGGGYQSFGKLGRKTCIANFRQP